MWDKDETETLSMDEWKAREARRNRRSLVIFGLMAIAWAAGLIYVATHP